MKKLSLALRLMFVAIITVISASLVSCRNDATSAVGCQVVDSAIYSPLEAKIHAAGLVDIRQFDSTIDVQLIYATEHNFMSRRLYHGLTRAFALPELARKVAAAHKMLKQLRPDLHFVIYDAARPISIQREMWAMVKGTDKCDFVSDPTVGRGMHNYGAAVDLTLVDCTGHPLPMGSEYDYFGDDARTNIEAQLLRDGRITLRELENRQLLRRVMTAQGLLIHVAEWWHFDLMTPEQARQTLKVVE